MAARSVLMVSPEGFQPDLETAADNAFQHPGEEEDLQHVAENAMQEFATVRRALERRGVNVDVFQGQPELPDAVFPNNWFSTHEDGTIVYYPMSTLSRRLERRPEIMAWLEERYPQVVDLTYNEGRDLFLEGTGSLVLDRENKIAYAALSSRTNETLVRNWCADLEYEPILFETSGPKGLPVYHTNVLMTLGGGYAVVCTECIYNPRPVISGLLASGRELIEITQTQMASFCGNMLQLQGHSGLLIMSASARDSFTSAQILSLERYAELVVVTIPTIERYGGGGVRCMLAELY